MTIGFEGDRFMLHCGEMSVSATCTPAAPHLADIHIAFLEIQP